jgi:hypothetical protein
MNREVIIQVCNRNNITPSNPQASVSVASRFHDDTDNRGEVVRLRPVCRCMNRT